MSQEAEKEEARAVAAAASNDTDDGGFDDTDFALAFQKMSDDADAILESIRTEASKPAPSRKANAKKKKQVKPVVSLSQHLEADRRNDSSSFKHDTNDDEQDDSVLVSRTTSDDDDNDSLVTDDGSLVMEDIKREMAAELRAAENEFQKQQQQQEATLTTSKQQQQQQQGDALAWSLPTVLIWAIILFFVGNVWQGRMRLLEEQGYLIAPLQLLQNWWRERHQQQQ